MSEEEYDDDDADDVPLHHLKPFGSGLRRKEIKFVPAASEDSAAARHTNDIAGGQSVSDFYLNTVLKKPDAATPRRIGDGAEDVAVEVCEVCKLPRPSTAAAAAAGAEPSKPSRHDASIAHQVCLTHSHPPSALDRRRVGLSILEAAGWDPDARTGLGAAAQGLQFPVKAKPKDDRLGVGVVFPKDGGMKRVKERPKLLDAKKVRKLEVERRNKTDRLQRQLFGRVDLDKYLGKDA